MNFTRAPKRGRQNITIAPELLQTVQREAATAGVPISHVIEGRLQASYDAERGVDKDPVIAQLQMDVEEILRLLRPVVAWLHEAGVGGVVPQEPPEEPTEDPKTPQTYYQAQLDAEIKTPGQPRPEESKQKGWRWR